MFGSKQKDKKEKKPNTIQVPPVDEENSKVEESTPDQPQQEVNPGLKALDSTEFFAGMNINKQEINPDGYNPPDLFAGMNLSMTQPPKNMSQPQMMNKPAPLSQSQMNPMFPMSGPMSGPMNTQNIPANSNTNAPITQYQPYVQPSTMPTQPTFGFNQDPNSMFFGMTPVDKSFDSSQNQLDTSARNISTEFVQITKEDAGQDANQTKSTENSNL